MDVLIVGAGAAGLSLAIKLSEMRNDLNIGVIAKADTSQTNTAFAQGGIAVVLDHINDSFENHIADTHRAGHFNNKEEIVDLVVRKAPERIEDLLRWGADFDRKDNNDFSLGLEGGHSHHRIIHQKDATGNEVQEKLLQKINEFPNIVLMTDFYVLEVSKTTIGEEEICNGLLCYHLPTKQSIELYAKKTVLATGGFGQIFKHTTNPILATGDGIAMAHRVGVKITDMHYVQYHPTALLEEGKNPQFLISEAVRGFGAYIIDEEGKRFTFQYDIRGELATRDIVSAAIIDHQIKRNTKVFLDVRHLNIDDFKTKFPSIYAYCIQVGIDPSSDLLPITPAAHYQTGGIEIDAFGKTSLNHLYASGECANSGLHGKNRLASNSLLEAFVFGHEIAQEIVATIDSTHLIDFKNTDEKLNVDSHCLTKKETEDYISELKNMMTYDLMFFKNQKKVQKALLRTKEIEKLSYYTYSQYDVVDLDLIQLFNRVQVCKVILEQLLLTLEVENHQINKCCSL